MTTTKITGVGVDAINKRAAGLMRDVAGQVKGLLPESVLDRVSREPRYACGFTGFKQALAWTYRQPLRGETEDDAIDQEMGLLGQFLVAVAPTVDAAMAVGKHTGEWRYYYTNVPPSGKPEGRFDIGDAFMLPPIAQRRKVIDWTDHDLLDALTDGALRVCQSVIDGEKDRTT